MDLGSDLIGGFLMRSDDWDERDREFSKQNGFAPRNDPRYHTHEYHDGRCVYCGKTREQVRREWQ